MAEGLRFPLRSSGRLYPPPSHPQKVFIDFGRRKPHTVLVDDAEEPVHVERLRELEINNAFVYLEEGCPRGDLADIVDSNAVFVIDGRQVKALRDRTGVCKSDMNDAILIRRLAQETPGAFRELAPKEKEAILEFRLHAYYTKVAELVVCLEHRQASFEKEFGEPLLHLERIIRDLEEEKQSAARRFDKYGARAKSLKIRGLGPIILAGILIRANPNSFSSLSAYLAYCGLKGSIKLTGRYNRRVRAIFHQFATSVVMQKDDKFYALYSKFKTDLRSKFPEYPPFRIEGMAKNRLATYLAKEIYRSFKPAGEGSADAGRFGYGRNPDLSNPGTKLVPGE